MGWEADNWKAISNSVKQELPSPLLIFWCVQFAAGDKNSHKTVSSSQLRKYNQWKIQSGHFKQAFTSLKQVCAVQHAISNKSEWLRAGACGVSRQYAILYSSVTLPYFLFYHNNAAKMVCSAQLSDIIRDALKQASLYEKITISGQLTLKQEIWFSLYWWRTLY